MRSAPFIKEIDICLSSMHYLEIDAAGLRLMVIFSEIIFEINPLCDLCDAVEDTSHYLLHCRNYSVERQVINDTVRVFQPLSINMILFGN